jgi:rhodanese-related sulfurtransferase
MQMGTVLLWTAFIVVLLVLAKTFFVKGNALAMDRITELKKEGAIVLDVRSVREFEHGHAPGSVNIPLKYLQERLSELDRAKPILVCCASGARSAEAEQMLKQAGFQQVHNAGPWTILR